MRHVRKKVVKVCEELTMFFFSIGADDITSHIALGEDGYTIVFQTNYQSQQAFMLEKLERHLSYGKDLEAEGEYWALAGTSELGEGTELMLLGMMISDYALDVTPHHAKLTIHMPTH